MLGRGQNHSAQTPLITLLQGFLCDEVYIVCSGNCIWHCCLVLYTVMQCFNMFTTCAPLNI